MKDNYILWIDDIRNPHTRESEHLIGQRLNNLPIVWARDVEQAQYCITELGIPCEMYLDHDLGMFGMFNENPSTVMDFLKWLQARNSEAIIHIWHIHYLTSNPDGKKNMISFIQSWKKVEAERHFGKESK